MKNLVYRVLSATVIAFLAATSYVPAQECYTPIEWIPKNYTWNQDRNRNFVDDEIDRMPPDQVINVILCLNACPEPTDLQRFTSKGGQLGYRGKYLSVIVVNDVPAGVAREMGQDQRIAMVELSRPSELYSNISMAAAKITSSATYSGNNIEQAFPSLDGSGVTIAIMDTGVDNEPSSTTSGTVHTAFPAWKFVNGYDAFLNIETDPDDTWSPEHGTHVAGIALGTQATYRGAAPGAKLVDIQVFKPSFSTLDSILFLAFDKVIQRRVAWGIDIVNMSFGKPLASDGTDAMSQYVNRIVREGIFVVVAAGNTWSPLIGEPAAADFAMTVASAYDQNTILRTDDVISGFSSIGPRNNDGDGMTTDEMKPDVTAYGEDIISAQGNTTNGNWSLSGTSMAAPQVAGLAALILEANPGMDPLSLKDLIESTAEDFGASGWDVNFGHGIINGHQAITEVLSPGADVKFSVYCNSTWGWWYSPDLYPSNPSVVEGVTNAVVVVVTNASLTTATNFKVRVGCYNFSNSTADFDIALVTIASLGPLASTTLTCTWIPEINGLPPGVVHACLKAYIIYTKDADPSNNCAQHNVDIVQTHSPAQFTMTVVNPTGEDLAVQVVTEPSADEIAAQGWELLLDEETANFDMGVYDCPKQITVGLQAEGDEGDGQQMPVAVTIVGTTPDGTELVLGGVKMIGENHNGTPKPPDRKVFDGIRHTAVGEARLWAAPAELTVFDLPPDGGADQGNGVDAWLGEAGFWQATLADFNTADLNDGAFISLNSWNSDTKVAEMRATDVGDRARLSSNFMTGSNRLIVEVYSNGELTAQRNINTGNFADVSGSLLNTAYTPIRSNGLQVYGEVAFDEEKQITVLSQPPMDVTGDRIVVRPMVQPPPPNHIAKGQILASGMTSFALTGEAGGAFGHPFHAQGNPVLNWAGNGTSVLASRVTARSNVGACADVPGLTNYDLTWQTLDPTTIPLTAYLTVTARGILQGTAGPTDLGSVDVTRVPLGAAVTADMSVLGATSYSVELYDGGALVYAGSGLGSGVAVADGWPHSGGHGVAGNGGPGFRLRWPGSSTFNFSDGSIAMGDDLRIMPEPAGAPLQSVTEVCVSAVGFDELEITNAETSGLVTEVEEPVTAIPGMPFRLYQNYPNPFDQRTVFKFDLFSNAYVDLEVYSLLGEKIATVVARELNQGTHEIEWKRPGSTLASGTYIYKLKVRPQNSDQTFELQQQMVILD